MPRSGGACGICMKSTVFPLCNLLHPYSERNVVILSFSFFKFVVHCKSSLAYNPWLLLKTCSFQPTWPSGPLATWPIFSNCLPTFLKFLCIWKVVSLPLPAIFGIPFANLAFQASWSLSIMITGISILQALLLSWPYQGPSAILATAGTSAILATAGTIAILASSRYSSHLGYCRHCRQNRLQAFPQPLQALLSSGNCSYYWLLATAGTTVFWPLQAQLL